MKNRPVHCEWIGLATVVVIGAACSLWVGVWRGLFLSVNITACAFYGYDKRQSRTKGWRVPETMLLAFAAAGGVPGSLLGQLLFNHKTTQSRFKRSFWAIVILQAIIVTGVLFYSRGGI